MKYSNKKRRERNNIPCKKCLIFPVCISKTKQTKTLVCEILSYWRLNYKGSDNRLWKSIDATFPGNIVQQIEA